MQWVNFRIARVSRGLAPNKPRAVKFNANAYMKRVHTLGKHELARLYNEQRGMAVGLINASIRQPE